MKGDKKLVLGGVILVAGFLQFIAVSLLTSGRPELRILSPISSGLVGACFVGGIGLVKRGLDPKVDKQKRIEEQDERNQLIRGKAGYLALCVTDAMLLLFGACLIYILENETAGLVCYGIVVASMLVFTVAYRVLNKKL